MRKTIPLLIFIMLLTGVSATSVSLIANPTTLNLNSGDSGSSVIDYTIDTTPDSLSGAYGLSVTGDFGSSSTTSVPYGANTTTAGSITLDINVPGGTLSGPYSSTVSLGGSSVTIPINVINTGDCKIITTFPEYSLSIKTDSSKVFLIPS